jgi:ABC-type multidrug transport system ATPase subunit
MPSLIFLDEPTSGLDSVISQEVMSFVHRLASQHRTVIATIHQVRGRNLVSCTREWVADLECLINAFL